MEPTNDISTNRLFTSTTIGNSFENEILVVGRSRKVSC